MSSICESLICCEEMNFEENWAWVDQRLEELYHCCSVTSDNCYDYIDAGLLIERWDRINNEMQPQYSSEFEDRLPCPAPICWVLYKNLDSQHCLEEEERRSRAESDISDHSDEVERALKRLDCQSPLPTGMFHIDFDYSHMYAVADEAESVSSSLEADNWFVDCSTIDHCSETSSSVMEWFVEANGYDSF